MLCDELKRKYSDITGPYYGCNEVDEAIAELKKKLMPCLNGDCILTCEVVEKYGKENAELKQKLEDVKELIKTARQMLEDAKASLYAEMVDAGMRERRLRRALWLARAKRAEETQFLWQVYCHCDKLYFCGPSGLATRKNPYRYISRKNDVEWDEFWGKIKNKCLKKAEEYK